MQGPTTIRDVATEAGVSIATVSRVLAGSSRVDPELRAKTLAAVERLGYRANRVAQALRTRSTGTVGMVVPNISNPFFPVIIQAVEEELRKHGTRLLLCDSGDDVGQEAELLRGLLDHRIDGILVSPCDRIASRSAVRMAAGRVPLVQIDRVAVGDLDYIGVDQEAAMGAVVTHLLDQGCRRLAYVSSSMHASTAAVRLRAYVHHVRPVDGASAKRVYVGDFSLAWGKEAAARILADGSLPDAIVCANDLLAVGVLDVLRHEGIAVPKDVLIAGFDDTVLATVAWPPLTSVRQPLEDIGREAVQIVLSAATESRPARTRLLPAELVVRDSTRRSDAPGRQKPPPRPKAGGRPPADALVDKERQGEQWRSDGRTSRSTVR